MVYVAHSGFGNFLSQQPDRKSCHGDCVLMEPLEPRLMLSTTYTVTSLADIQADDGMLTLREAIVAANTDAANFDAPAGNGADIIQFDLGLFAGPATILLDGSQLEISDDLTITGPGANLLSIDADNSSRVFQIAGGAIVAISGLAVTGGNDGGISNTGLLTLTGVTVAGNHAPIEGGGIYNNPTAELHVVNSLILGNTAGYFGGGIVNMGTAELLNSTITGNESNRYGGGIFSSSAITVINATIAENTADANNTGLGTGGGIYIDSGLASLHNTIVAGNSRGTAGQADDVRGTFDETSNYNIIGVVDNSTGLTAAESTSYGTGANPLDAKLAPLMENGGPSQTHALLPGSPAFDAGDNNRAVTAGLTTDQRGLGYDRIRYGTVDIGAFEGTRGATIGRQVWADRNGNGQIDTGENGIDGITVSLYEDDGDGIFEPGSDDVLLDTQTTSGDGMYDFVSLNAGTYWVDVDETATIIADYTMTGGTDPMMVTLATEEDYNDANFGFCQHLFIVNTLIDEVDYSLTDETLGLREALERSATTPGADVIEFDPALNGGTITIDASLGEMTIASEVIIQGPGSDLLAIDAVSNSRIFYFPNDVGNIEINGLELTRGRVTYRSSGGCMYINSGNIISMTDVLFYANDNTAQGTAGCIYNIQSDLSLIDCDIIGSHADNGSVGAISSSGPLLLDGCTISGCSAYSGGGGISSSGADATLVIRNSTISNNGLSHNEAYGAGINIGGGTVAEIFNSTIKGNHSSSSSGIYVGEYATLYLSGSTIANNDNGDYSSNGGLGIYGVATIVNSTITENHVGRSAGGIYVASTGTVCIINSTITNNRANAANSNYDGGGIKNAGGILTLHNTIVAGNFNYGGVPDDIAGNCTSSSSNNLIGVDDGLTGISNGPNGNIIGTLAAPVDPLLGVLEDNYGPTQTHQLQPGSPAINAGSNFQAQQAVLVTDQRGTGFDRIVGDIVDIGAYERAGAGTIGDYIWNDADNNAIQDTGEAGIDNVTVNLYLDDGDELFEPGGDDVFISTQNTAGGGAYDFTELPLGDYWVDVDETSAALTGAMLVAGSEPLLVELSIDEDYNDADFGYYNPIVVSTLTDENDGDYSAGDLSLREALVIAAGRAGTDIILFDPEIIANASIGLDEIATITLDTGLGEMDITSGVDIRGPGEDSLVIDADLGSRIFEVNVAASISVEISGMTLMNGSANGGGAMWIQNASTVFLTDVTLTENRSVGTYSGGAIAVYGGVLTATRCEFSHNDVIDHYGAGAIYMTNDADLNLYDCDVINNHACSGGGISTNGANTIVIRNSRITDNWADRYGSGGYGGGLFISAPGADVEIYDSTISGNLADYYGGGIVLGSDCTLLISGSTISGNSAIEHSGAGLRIHDSHVTIINSTISGNTGGYGGGAIWNSASILDIRNSTITLNRIEPVADRAAGIHAENDGQIILRNTIVAGNTIFSTNENIDVFGTVTALDSYSVTAYHSIIGATSDLADGVDGNHVGTTAAPIDSALIGLGPLQDNHGPTQTHAIDITSIAIDAGDASLAVDSDNNPLTSDQRGGGFPRSVGVTVDIGAFELGGDASIGDFVWNDRNTDGVQNAGEPGIDGVTVNLYVDDGDGIFEGPADDTLIDSRETINGGAYDFVGLGPGDYWVLVDETSQPLNGFELTGGVNPRLITLTTDEVFSDADFGYYWPIKVSTLVDENDGDYSSGDLSLREALAIAFNEPGWDMIYFDESLAGGTIYLEPGRGQLTVDSELEIQGLGAGKLTFDAGGYDRALYIADNISVVVTGLTMTGGQENNGAGIYLDTNSTLTAGDLSIESNSADYQGGAVYVASGASLNLSNSSLTENSAGDRGGAIFVNNGNVNLANVTISANRADFRGGGIYADSGTVDITNATIAFNAADSDGNATGEGGGIYVDVADVSVSNTIIAKNYRGDETTADDLLGQIQPGSVNNLIGLGDASTGLQDGVNGNQVGSESAVLDPRLLPLATYGGTTKIHALQITSPALDAGSNTATTTANLTTDQRGVTRFTDHDKNGTATVDIGAYEAGQPIVVNAANDEVEDSDSLISLREAIDIAAGLDGFDVIIFDASLAGQTIALDSALGEIVISSDVDIQGLGADELTLDAGSNSRVIRVETGCDVWLSGFTITGGSANLGGGINNAGSLKISGVEIRENSAGNDGGGIYNTGEMKITASTLAGNLAQHGGGFTNASAGQAWLGNVTISGNSVTGDGGGVSNAGLLNLTNVTVTANRADNLDIANGEGGGVHVSAGTATVYNTIIAGNYCGSNTDNDVSGNFATASSYNIIGAVTGSTGLTAGVGTQYGSAASPLDAKLTDLGYYDEMGNPVAPALPGAPTTRTHGLLPGSPATDTGSNAYATNAGLLTDQRGMDRIRDGRDDGLARVDIGAFEQQIPLNQAPTLTSVDVLAGAVEGVSFVISYELLMSSSDAADPDTQGWDENCGFLIDSVVAGTLRLNGSDATGEVLLQGQSLIWTPPSMEFGEDPTAILNAFTVRAWDGMVESASAVNVSVEVTSTAEPVNYAVLFSGGDKVDVNYGIYYQNLKELYQILIDKYGLAPHNIFVVYADGRDPSPDQRGGTEGVNSDMSFAENVLSATSDNLRDTLVSLSQKVDANDHFFMWTFDHGMGATRRDDITGEEILKGWGVGETISDEELRVWLQGLQTGDDAEDYDGIEAGYEGINAAYSTYVFAQCFSGGMLDDLITGENVFGMAASNHYEASYSDYFASAFNDGLSHGFNTTADAFAYAFQNDGRAESNDGVPNGGDWTFNIEHPWSAGGDFPIFAMTGQLNANPELTTIVPLKCPAAEYELEITYDLLMAASDADDPTGQAVIFNIEAVAIGEFRRNGVLIDLENPADTVISYDDVLTWQRPGGTTGTLSAFTITVLDGQGLPACSPVVVPVRIGDLPAGPIAEDDSLLLQENSIDALIDVLGNDTGSDLAVTDIGVASHGEVTLNMTTGQVRYTPAADFNGEDSFTYVISDGANTDIATVSISVVPYDPTATGGLEVTYTLTELTPPPGWAGLDESWDWAFRSTLPDWTETKGVDISEDGVVVVSISRPLSSNPLDDMNYLGSTNAGYSWQSGDTEPYWNWETLEVDDDTVWVGSSNIFMFLDETVWLHECQDGVERYIYHGIEALSIDNIAAIPAIRYLDPDNANEAGLPSIYGVWHGTGTGNDLWQEVPEDICPTAINNSYQAAATDSGNFSGLAMQAEVWNVANPAETPTLSITLPGWGGTEPRSSSAAINEAGHVIGHAEFQQDDFHAFFFDDINGNNALDAGEMFDIGALPGFNESIALGLSEDDKVVGYSTNTPGVSTSGEAFLWDYTTRQITALGTLSGGWSIAYDVNNSGVAVGQSDGHAFVWAGGVMYDLNSLIDDLPAGYTLLEANAINNSGQIVATGVNATGESRAFFLEVVHTIDAVDDAYQTGQSDAIQGNVLINDQGSLTVTDVDDTNLTGQITWNADGSFTFSPAGHFDHLSVGQSEQTSFTYTVSDGHGGMDNATVTITVLGVADLDTLYVTEICAGPAGVDVEFVEEIDTSTLNLYDGNDAADDTPDVIVTGNSTGEVDGSIFWDSASRTLSFVPTGGVLQADTYTITLSGAAGGITNISGDALDGNGDNIPGGDFSFEFTVEASTDRVVSLPDFTAGPGQTVNVPATGSGLPIRIDNAQGVTAIDMELEYDPQILSINGVSLADGMPAGWSVTRNFTQPGKVILSLIGTTELTGSARDLLILHAEVPTDAPYGLSQVITLTNLSINEDAISSVADQAVHVAAYMGDADGNAAYTGYDAALIARVLVELDSGLDFNDWVDPAIICDVTGNGSLSGLDTSYVAQAAAGETLPTIPAIPGIVNIPTTGEITAELSIPSNIPADPGLTVTVPVSIDQAAGVISATFDVLFNSDKLEIESGDVGNGMGWAAGDNWSLTGNLIEPGRIRVVIWNTSSTASSTCEIANLVFTVKSAAPGGITNLDIQPLDSKKVGWTDFDGCILISGTGHLPGDANGDGVVSASDYASVRANFGHKGDPGIPGDANGDGLVSADDFGSIQANFGNTASAAIPQEEITPASQESTAPEEPQDVTPSIITAAPPRPLPETKAYLPTIRLTLRKTQTTSLKLLQNRFSRTGKHYHISFSSNIIGPLPITPETMISVQGFYDSILWKF